MRRRLAARAFKLIRVRTRRPLRSPQGRGLFRLIDNAAYRATTLPWEGCPGVEQKVSQTGYASRSEGLLDGNNSHGRSEALWIEKNPAGQTTGGVAQTTGITCVVSVVRQLIHPCRPRFRPALRGGVAACEKGLSIVSATVGFARHRGLALSFAVGDGAANPGIQRRWVVGQTITQARR